MNKQTDFPELEGKYIKTRLHITDKVKDKVVVGCNYYVGITFRSTTKYKGEYTLTCITFNNYSIYEKIFYSLIEGIKNGYLVFEGEFASINNVIKPNCPFIK